MADNGITELVKAIETAFADTPYPGDGQIGTLELDFSFRGLNWKQVPIEVLFYHRDETSSFTPEGFRFYLPAMMFGVLLHFEEVDTLTQNLIYRLVPAHDDYLDNSYWGGLNRIVAVLNRKEKEAVYKFLLGCRQLDEKWGFGETGRRELEEGIKFWRSLTS